MPSIDNQMSMRPRGIKQQVVKMSNAHTHFSVPLVSALPGSAWPMRSTGLESSQSSLYNSTTSSFLPHRDGEQRPVTNITLLLLSTEGGGGGGERPDTGSAIQQSQEEKSLARKAFGTFREALRDLQRIRLSGRLTGRWTYTVVLTEMAGRRRMQAEWHDEYFSSVHVRITASIRFPPHCFCLSASLVASSCILLTFQFSCTFIVFCRHAHHLLMLLLSACVLNEGLLHICTFTDALPFRLR